MTTTVGSDANVDAALANLVVVLADNKYFLGRRLSESAIGAPTLESAVACAAIAQEELGHTRPLYSFLEQVPSAPVPLERDDDRERKYCLTLLRERFPTWPHAMAALFLVDAAVTIMLEGLAQAGPDVLRRRASRVVADEPTHARFAVGPGPGDRGGLGRAGARALRRRAAAGSPLLVRASRRGRAGDVARGGPRRARQRAPAPELPRAGHAGSRRGRPRGRHSLERASRSMGVRAAAVGELEQPGETPRACSGGEPAVRCVWCESEDVERLGDFGPGLMTEQWFCRACRSPFELVRKRGRAG